MDQLASRLEAAKVTLDSFLGPSSIFPTPDPGDELSYSTDVQHVKGSYIPWSMLEPRVGYNLYVDESSSNIEVVILKTGKQSDELLVAGAYSGTMLRVADADRGKGLSRELILAAFGKWPWDNRERKFTASGVRAFISAHNFIATLAATLGNSQTLNKDELEKAIPHVAFEFYHFRLYDHIVGSPALLSSPRGLPQAVGYAFLLHMRALLDFFFLKKPIKDDLIARQFSPIAIGGLAYARPQWLREVKRELDQKLAHITTARWRNAQQNMSYYRGHFEEIDACIVAFLNALEPWAREAFEQNMQEKRRDDLELWRVTRQPE